MIYLIMFGVWLFGYVCGLYVMRLAQLIDQLPATMPPLKRTRKGKGHDVK